MQCGQKSKIFTFDCKLNFFPSIWGEKQVNIFKFDYQLTNNLTLKAYGIIVDAIRSKNNVFNNKRYFSINI